MIDTESISDISDESPPEVEEASSSGQAAADNDEHTDVCDEAQAADEADRPETTEALAGPMRRFSWKRTFAYAALPAAALVLALVAAVLKWQVGSAAGSQAAGAQSTQAAKERTIAMLSYHPDTVDKDLSAAANGMTGKFRDDYTQLIKDVVIPGAKQKKISSVATVPAAASVSATPNHAVVMLFVNQTTVIGADTPTDTASSVRVTLDKVHERWLVSHFDPI